MKDKTVNREVDTARERNMSSALRGESVESPSFGDKYKADLSLRFAQKMCQTSSAQTRNIWINITQQLQDVCDEWNQ